MEPSTANAADRRVTKASVGAAVPTVEEGDDIGASALQHELSEIITTTTTLQTSDIINTVCFIVVGQRWGCAVNV